MNESCPHMTRGMCSCCQELEKLRAKVKALEEKIARMDEKFKQARQREIDFDMEETQARVYPSPFSIKIQKGGYK